MNRPRPTAPPYDLRPRSRPPSVVGEGEWAAARHGGTGKRGWKQLHMGVDESGVIIAQVLTDGHADDAVQFGELLGAVEGDIIGVIGDAAYDTVAVYDVASASGAEVIVPPTRTAAVSQRRPRSPARDRTLERVKEVEGRQWMMESGYHQQGTVENAIFRYKSTLGDRLRARSWSAQMVEALTACNVLNRMLHLGRPTSVAIGA
jgi:hypothetical protein